MEIKFAKLNYVSIQRVGYMSSFFVDIAKKRADFIRISLTTPDHISNSLEDLCLARFSLVMNKMNIQVSIVN